MDFRDPAAQATRDLLYQVPGSVLTDLQSSGCVPIPGGRPILVGMSVVGVTCGFFTVLTACLSVPLMQLHVLRSDVGWGLLLGGLGLAMTHRMIAFVIVKLLLKAREESLLRFARGLPALTVGLEDGKSYEVTKFVIEDQAVCLLDQENRRLLIEGCVYRYMIRGEDVLSVEKVSGYAMSGARLKCRMAGQDFDMVIAIAGQGPIRSLTHAFVPGEGAKTIASRINQTLFGLSDPAYRKPAAPPPLPGG